ncbi:MAG: dockerin type I repeat-containing protein [Prevotella sp.]|nr:dockerin type I repeat-containing protein [Prevotella sp.]
MRKTIFLTLLACGLIAPRASAVRLLLGGEYWIDGNYNAPSTVAIGKGGVMQFSLDATTLSEGLHTLYYRAFDSAGFYSPVQSWLFYRGQLANQRATAVTTYEYWTDQNAHQTGTVVGNEVQFTLDASTLSEGLHTLHYRLMDNQGHYSPIQSWLFYRAAAAYTGGKRTLEYWIDNGELKKEAIPDDGSLKLAIDGSALAEGLHTLCYRIREEGGHLSPQQQWMFYRRAPQQATRISWVRYWWNNHEDKAVQAEVEADEDGNCLFAQQLTVPEYARNDGWSDERLARLFIIFGDDLGHTSALQWADVRYPEIQVLLGDANGDGRVDIADVMTLLNRMAGRNTGNFVEQQADLNRDGRITMTDVVTLITLINLQIEE